MLDTLAEKYFTAEQMDAIKEGRAEAGQRN